jgi:hypothetical protein
VVKVLLGNGDGTFRIFPFRYTIGDGASSVVPADLNGDGYPDLALTNHQSVVVPVNDGLWPADPGGIGDSPAPISSGFPARASVDCRFALRPTLKEL